MIITTEYQLQVAVVKFLKQKYPESLYTAPCGELLNTRENRMKYCNKGYVAGSPDLMILNKNKDYTGLIFELKTPKAMMGVLSPAQKDVLAKQKRNGYKVIVSNDYSECIVAIIEYFQGVQYGCEFCSRMFKTGKSSDTHRIKFHLIDPESEDDEDEDEDEEEEDDDDDTTDGFTESDDE